MIKVAAHVNRENKDSLKQKNLFIFLTAAAVIAKCAEVYENTSPQMAYLAQYISVFMVPLFAFAAGMISKSLTRREKSCLGSLALIGGAYILLKIISLFTGVYFLEESFGTALFTGDMAWIYPAVIVWIACARVLKRKNLPMAILVSAAAGIGAGFLREGVLTDAISKIFVFAPFFLAGNYMDEVKAIAFTNRRWLKLFSAIAAVLLLIIPLIKDTELFIGYACIFSGGVISGNPFYMILDRMAAYIISAFVSALWFCAVPGRRFLFTGFAGRSFQVFFWYGIVIDLWLHFNMNSIYKQILAGREILLFLISMAVIMVFIALIPLPVFSRYMDRIKTGKWRLAGSGDPIFKRIKQYSFLFSELVKRDFKQKYKRTVLGMLWSVLSPLLTLLVMWLVFSEFFGKNTAHYVVYIFSGNLVYSYFRESTSEGMSSLVDNSGIFTKVNVPKYMFLFSKNISSLISFGLTLIVFFIFVAVDGLPFTWKYIYLLYPIFCLMVFNVGLGLILSALYIFFKDIKYLWSIFTLLLMYMSAIFYNIESYSATAQNLFLLNPIYVYIRYFRKIVIEGSVPTLWFHLIAIIYAGFFFYIGLRMYKKNNTKFLYYV